MVWVKMSVAPNVVNKKRKKTDSKPQSQANKCLNEKRRREQENIYIEELAELISASTSDMSSLSVKPDKCAILQETVNQIRLDKHKPELANDLQQSEVSSSKPTILANDIYGPLLLEALDGFLFVVNLDGKIEFVSENIVSFLKYSQDEIVEKSIYNIIHSNDRVRFSNNLLPMSLGNGRDWPTENNPSSNSASKTRSFNCRFLIKPSEDQETSMENKQSSVPQYENMQVSSVLFPFNNDSSEADANKDQQNRLACVARRIPSNEKSPTSLGVEQFTTRLDHTGKIMDIDTSGVSSTYSQYLNKEFVGSMMIDFCHASDLNKLKQHLTETLESGCNTSAVYKLQVGNDRYVRVQTKSKKFNSTQSANEQVIVSTHSIIRDSDSPGPSLVENSQRNEPSTSGQISASTNMPVTSTSVNGSTGISSLTLSTSYGNFSVLSPNDSDLAFNDYMMDMFPGSTWTLDQNSSHSKDSDNMAATGFIANSPQGGPASNRSDMGSGTRTANSAFSPGRSVSSPTVPGRAPTPYGNNMSCFSPSAAQQMGGKTSPSAMPVKTDTLCSSSPDTVGINSLSQNIKQERQFKSNQKLRNLLTQNVDDSNSRLNSRTATQDEVTILNESRAFEVMPRLGRANSRDNNCISQIPRTSSNVILRDLLNQDDDDSEAPVEPIVRNMDVNMTNTLTPPLCKMNEQGVQQRPNNNNMLRKLLNNDDVDRNYRKSQDLIHQLLIAGSADKGSSFQNEKMKSENIPSPRLSDSPVSKQTSINSNRMMSDISYLSESGATKRKSLDKNLPNSANKRQTVGSSNHAHLAGQNPMLASMLAQTPRTPPSVPTSVASTIMTQLPQERLPENLEKKIVHTPYTVTAVSGTSTSTQAISPVHQDVVTSDSRGHVMHHPQLGLQSGLNNNKYGYSQPQQGFFDKIFNTDDNILIARSLALNLSTIQTSTQNSQVFAQNLTHNTVESSASSNIVDILNDAALADPDSIQTSQANDPSFAEILEQIYSLQEDLNVEANQGTDDRGNILKILGDVIEPSQINAVPRPVATTQVSAHELSEKIAISAIQKQLMSFEGSSLTIASRTGPAHNSMMVPTYSQAGRPSTQVSGTPVMQTQLTQEQLTMLQQQQQQLSAPPNYNSSLVTNRVKLPVTNTYISNNPDLIAQAQRRGLHIVKNTYSGIATANANHVNQIRKTIMEKKKYLAQQQKRLLEQQQKQHLSMQTQQPLDVINSPGTPSFPENMNDLLNNSVAPNVTLLRSSNVQDVQNNARFALANPLPSPVAQTSTPSQLSPGQRGNPQSPFSPLSQQPFSSQTPPPSTYQQARLSPHPPPSYPQGGPSLSPPIPPTGSPLMGLSPQSNAGSPQWNQRPVASPIPNNLQLQNPMLNAQLSQQASASANQIRLSAQQRQQLALRSLPSPTSVQSARNSVFSNNADPNYSPLSPITVLQNQSRAQQQRIQRTLSGPGRLTINAQNQSNLATNEALLSPQSLPSPKYAQSVASTAVSSFVSLPSPGGGLTYSLAQDGQFNFDRQNIQTFTSNANESLRSSTNIQASDFIRQELRAVVARNQSQSVSSNLDQQTLSMLQSTSGSQGTISDNQETLHDLGLSVQELITVNEAQQKLYSQALLNATSSLENSSQQPSAASSRVEEPKPDQKKSLLQQLLSEPT